MDVENREPLYTLGADVNLCGYVGKQYGGSSKKTKNRIAIASSSSTPGYAFRKKAKTKRLMYPVFIVSL